MKQLFAGFALAATCLAAQAYELTFQGVIKYTDGSLSGVAVGGLIQGTFQGDGAVGYPYFGKFDNLVDYRFSSSSLKATVAGHDIASTKAAITVFDNFDGNIEDQFKVTGALPTVDGVSLSSGTFSFALASRPGNTGALVGAGLPGQIDMAAFNYLTWNQGQLLRNGAPGGVILGFDIMSVKVTAVPEPDATWLVLVGGVAVVAARTRRREPT